LLAGRAGRVDVQINGDLIHKGVIPFYTISNSGEIVVYISDREFDDIFKLYSVPIDSGISLELNGVLTPNGDVQQVIISPNSKKVVYRSDQSTDAINELYSSNLTINIQNNPNSTFITDNFFIEDAKPECPTELKYILN